MAGHYWGHFADKPVELIVRNRPCNEKLVLADTHTHIQLKHCRTIQSPVENSYVFTILYNRHCTHIRARCITSTYETKKIELNFSAWLKYSETFLGR